MNEQTQEQPVDRKDLKIQALLEKISNMTAQYENQLADARVEVTMLSNFVEQQNVRISELEGPDETSPEDSDAPDEKN